MIVQQTLRALCLLTATTTTLFIQTGYGQEPTETPASELVAVGSGSPKESVCGTPEVAAPCVAIPVFVKAVNNDGEEQRMTVEYRVAQDMVDSVRKDFGDASPVLLRNLQKSLIAGIAAPKPNIKLASKQALPVVNAHVPYTVLPGVKMPLKVEKRVAEVAHRTAAMSGKKITVTSGNRSATRQAEAMRAKIALGENLRNLYANKEAINEVLYAYHAAKANGASQLGVVGAMAEVIAAQTERGIFLSNHLREGAVDVRTKDLSGYQKQAVLNAVSQVPGVRALVESTPPHIHLDVG